MIPLLTTRKANGEPLLKCPGCGEVDDISVIIPHKEQPLRSVKKCGKCAQEFDESRKKKLKKRKKPDGPA